MKASPNTFKPTPLLVGQPKGAGDKGKGLLEARVNSWMGSSSCVGYEGASPHKTRVIL